MKKYIMSLDQGTTSSRCILFEKDGTIASVVQREFPQIFPKEGWVEHNPMTIWSTQIAACTEALLKIGATWDEVHGIGITNQRETTVIWDRKTGIPVYNAIVWQCRRTADFCEELKKNGYEKLIKEKTGLLIDPYFSGTKIKWILDNVDGVRERAERGELCFGTIDTWLIWNLTGGKVHATDYSNASRTMIFNINTLEWDDELLKLLDIPRALLPEVKPSSSIFGHTDAKILGASLPIGGVAGDQQAALFGQCCFDVGDAKNTYGTGCFLLANTGNTPVFSSHGLLTTIAASEAGAPIEYALEGSVFVGGALIQWLRDELKLIYEAKDSEYYASKVKSSGGVYVVPAFTGLGAPYWDMHARGTILGLTRGSGRNHIIRACLEAIAFQTEDVLNAMRDDMKNDIASLKVDGGASANALLMQTQSDISGIEVLSPSNAEATATGAAFLAGLAVGFFESRDELLGKIDTKRSYSPSITDGEREAALRGWHRALRACMEFSKED